MSQLIKKLGNSAPPPAMSFSVVKEGHCSAVVYSCVICEVLLVVFIFVTLF